MLQPFLRRVNARAAARPLFTAVVVATTKNVVADLIIQKGVEQKEAIDWRRTALFGSFGMLFVGAAQYKVLVKWAPRVFGLTAAGSLHSPRRTLAAVKIVAFDQLFFCPFMYLPTFFVMREVALSTGASTSRCTWHVPWRAFFWLVPFDHLPNTWFGSRLCSFTKRTLAVPQHRHRSWPTDSGRGRPTFGRTW